MYIFSGWKVRIRKKLCPKSRLYSWLRGQFFPIRPNTDRPRPANHVVIFSLQYCLESNFGSWILIKAIQFKAEFRAQKAVLFAEFVGLIYMWHCVREILRLTMLVFGLKNYVCYVTTSYLNEKLKHTAWNKIKSKRQFHENSKMVLEVLAFHYRGLDGKIWIAGVHG